MVGRIWGYRKGRLGVCVGKGAIRSHLCHVPTSCKRSGHTDFGGASEVICEVLANVEARLQSEDFDLKLLKVTGELFEMVSLNED